MTFGRSFTVSGRCLFGISVVASLAATSSALSLDKRDLPWEELKNKLSLDAQRSFLENSGPEHYVQQCIPVFLKENPTQFELYAQTDGLCMNTYSCGFQNCNPFNNVPDFTSIDLIGPEAWGPLLDGGNLSDLSDFALYLLSVPSGPNAAFNIPSKVLFPVTVGDVVAAVNFANKHLIELSVKASGHHLAGASTKKDTLLLNMRDYKKYSPTGLVDCSTTEEGYMDGQTIVWDSNLTMTILPDPCRFARARNVPAYIKVGGGETFAEVYESIKNVNEEGESYKYHLTGAAAATVTPMGWTFQGGLSATTGGRRYGFGVDQVLQIEAVLPTGEHVLFGPTSWEEQSQYLYPTPTQVTGVCNTKPFLPKDEWEWQLCSRNINFDDLWYAFLGGGGGTFGIVTSIYLQLQDYFPLQTFDLGSSNFVNNCGVPNEYMDWIMYEVWDFTFDFYLNPSVLNVSETDSNACGGSFRMHCYGDGAAQVGAKAWQKRIVARSDSFFVDYGVNASTIAAIAVCPRRFIDIRLDYASPLLTMVEEGKDAAPPSFPNFPAYEFLIPSDWILENKKKTMAILKSQEGGLYTGGYMAYGGATANAQTEDATSLSIAHRRAGIMIQSAIDTDLFWEDLQDMYDFTGGIDNIPAFLGSNHYKSSVRGPLKLNLGQPCPLDLTPEERDEKCVPLQKILWGSKTLARLEAIKEAVDPNRILDCQTCVGNNKPREQGSDETPPVDTTETSTDSTEAGNNTNPEESTNNGETPTGSSSATDLSAMALRYSYLLSIATFLLF